MAISRCNGGTENRLTFEHKHLMLLTINLHKLYVEVHGTEAGFGLVLLHHGIGSVNAWKAQVSPYVTAGYRVIVYDRWGYGRSAPRPDFEPPAFTNDVEDLASVLDHFQLHAPVLIGHSDGGTIALEFGSQYPTRVSGLILIAAHVYVEPKMYSGILGIGNAYLEKARFRKALGREHGEKTDELFQAWYRGWSRPENNDWDIRPRLKKIACPTLVVQGLADEHNTPEHARQIAAGIPDAMIWLVPETGHMLPQEIPELFNERVLAFLSEIS